MVGRPRPLSAAASSCLEAGLARGGQAVHGDPEPAPAQPGNPGGYLADHCRPLRGRRCWQRLPPGGHGLERLHVPTIPKAADRQIRVRLATESGLWVRGWYARRLPSVTGGCCLR